MVVLGKDNGKFETQWNGGTEIVKAGQGFYINKNPF